MILLAWAGLPWLVGLAMRATRLGGWRDPALFALTVLLVGSVNASALQLVGIAPVLWVVLEMMPRARGLPAHAGRRRPASACCAPASRCGGSWRCGAQAAYGLPVLDLTETLETVARSSTPTDLLRGLGNWFFYGQATASGRRSSRPATTPPVASSRLASFAVPVLALVAAASCAGATASYFVLLVVVGTVVGVGAWPLRRPEPVRPRVPGVRRRHRRRAVAAQHAARRARCSCSASPALLAAGVGALAPKWRELGSALVVGALVLVAFLPVWRVGYFSEDLERDEDVPAYWDAAARAIDAERRRHARAGDPRDRTSRRTGGATPSSRSSQDSSTAPPSRARCSRSAPRARSTCSTRSTTACRRARSSPPRSHRSRA